MSKRRPVRVLGVMAALVALIATLLIAAPIGGQVAQANTPKGILVATTITAGDVSGVNGADRLPGVDIEVYVNGVSATTGTTTKTVPGAVNSPTTTDQFGTALDTDTLIICATTPAGHTFSSVIINPDPIADPDNSGRDCNQVLPARIAGSGSNVVIVFDYDVDKGVLVATTIDADDGGGVPGADRLPGVDIEVYVNGVSTTTGTTTKTAPGSGSDPGATDQFGTAKDTDTLIICATTPAAHTFSAVVINPDPIADPDNNGRNCNELVPARIAGSVDNVVVVFDYDADKGILVATTIDAKDVLGTNTADRLPGVDIEVYVNGVSTTTGATTKTAPGAPGLPANTDQFGTAKDTDTLIVCATTPAAHTFSSVIINPDPIADPDNNGRDCNELIPARIAGSVNNVVVVFDYQPDKPILVATTNGAGTVGGVSSADRLPGVDIEVYVNGVSTTTGATTKTAPGSSADPGATDQFGTAKDTDTLIICATQPNGYTFNAVLINPDPIADPDNNGRDCNEISSTIISNTVNVVPVVFDYTPNPPSPPLFSKVFNPDGVLPRGTTLAVYTIDNRANLTLTDFTFLDPPPAPLTGSQASLTSDCARIAVDASWKFTGTVDAVDVCTISVTITAPLIPDKYVTTTSALSTPKGNAPAAQAVLDVVNPVALGFQKTFDPDAIADGATTTLSFTVNNPNNAAVSGVGFIDDLPVGMTVAAGAILNTCGGTVVAPVGGTSIKLNQGTVDALAECKVSVPVTAPLGTHNNTTGVLQSELGAGPTASDTLHVLEPLDFDKAFVSSTILDTETTTMRFTFTNPNDVGVGGIAFTDVFPVGMVIATPLQVASTCIGGTIDATARAAAMSVAGVVVGSKTSCTITVEMTAPGGTHVNTVSDLTSTAGQSPSASATLTVTATCRGQAVTHDMNVLGVNVLTTTGADDVILGTPNDDIINARGGDDLVCAGEGDDTVNGEGGNDEIYGEGGDDEIRGGNGHDELRGGTDDDEIHGESGRDVIRGGAGRDKAFGGDDDDDIAGGTENDRLEGGLGDDEIRGDEGNDRVNGDEGADVIRGGDGDDKLYGNQGDDELHGDDGNDRVNGGHDNDVLNGGDGDDNLRGRSGADEVNGNAGNDSLRGETGDDVLNGGGDDDNLRGEGGDDELDGGNGTDHCNGGNHQAGDRYRASKCDTITKVEIPF